MLKLLQLLLKHLWVLFLYLMVRHFLFVLMFMDIVIGWLRQFRWFPKEGRRRHTLLHWLVALALLAGFIALAVAVGWMKIIPK